MLLEMRFLSFGWCPFRCNRYLFDTASEELLPYGVFVCSEVELDNIINGTMDLGLSVIMYILCLLKKVNGERKSS